MKPFHLTILIAVVFAAAAPCQETAADSATNEVQPERRSLEITPLDGVAATDPASSAALKLELEKKYSEKYQDKIERETKRVEESMGTLFYGMAGSMIGLLVLGVFALMRTKAQQRELDLLRDEVAHLKPSGTDTAQ